MKKEMRAHNILGKQASDERLYLKREDVGREIKSDVEAAWTREPRKKENAILSEGMKRMEDIGIAVLFQEGCILIEDEIVEGGWKLAWKS